MTSNPSGGLRIATGPAIDVASFEAVDLPLIRYEQQPGVGLAVRKYVMMKRGLLASAAQRKPAAPLTKATQGEVDQLLRRLARHFHRTRTGILLAGVFDHQHVARAQRRRQRRRAQDVA